ncbi:hypothetical protein E2C01_038959 [Portunus trituberculatus]|uniref:Uncharacterized protein n=1 Tax=Portunus trituberculatus TaxID=210409 RepID=A0A5B7FLG2_PORTR|nr:hypothetical protein [Portunus trituberculatus]
MIESGNTITTTTSNTVYLKKEPCFASDTLSLSLSTPPVPPSQPPLSLFTQASPTPTSHPLPWIKTGEGVVGVAFRKVMQNPC